jgi:signal transduction histidine kinase
MSVAEITSAPPAQRIEELGRIILAYSEVTEKLQQSHDRLEQTVTALREELSEKNRMLERRNRLAALGEMAAGMAHEIRNPLGGIQLYASMLSSDVADRPQSYELAQKIGGCVRKWSAVSCILPAR